MWVLFIMISEEKINEIRKSINIVDIIGEYISIEQKGKNYFAVCPFHDDHNPSMSISPEKQIYTCFVCGAHGNVFTFLMEYEHISFIEAVKNIANRVGIYLDVPNFKEKQVDEKVENQYEIYDIANKFYQNNLNTKDGTSAREYLNNRDFKEEIIKEFGIGLSTTNKLTKLLINKKFNNDMLVNSGISSKKDTAIYDTFIDRIMFPLCDLDGRVIGFSGRIYKNSDTSKYINSKESDIFKKGKILYNYHRAKDEVRKKKKVIIVEGFMDVIALYKVGIKNVVATMGTAVTIDQARIIKKLSSNVILCFDGDEAGNNATISCSKELENVGIVPEVIRLPENLDPDEYLKKYGKEKYIEYIENAKSLLDYKIDYYKSNTNFSNTIEVSKYIKDVLLELSQIDDKIVKELTIKKLSDETNISITSLKGMVKSKKEEPKKVVKTKSLNKYEKAERRLLFYMLRHSEVIKIYENNKCYIPTKEFRYLASEVIYYYNKHKQINIADFLSYLNDKKELLDAFNLIDIMDISENYSYDEIMDYINLLNDYSVKEEINKLTDEFKKTIDDNRKEELAREISKLKVSE